MPQVTLQQAFDLARQFQSTGHSAEAEAVYQQILAADPNHVDALQLLGVLEHQRGNSRRALELIGKAVSLRPDFASCRSNLGMVLAGLGQMERAIEEFERAVTINPKSAEAFNNLASAFQSVGKTEEAINAYRRAVELRPDFAMAHNNLGATLCEAGRVEEGVECFNRVIALEPNFIQGYANLGKALLKKGDAEAAADAFGGALRLQPADPEMLVNFGVALQSQGRIDDAIGSYRQALSALPAYADAWANLGVAYQQKQQLDDAIEAYQHSLAARGDVADTHGNLATALTQMGRTDDALAEHRIAQSLNPNARLASTFLVFTHMHPDFTPQTIWEEHVRWREKFIRPLGPPRFAHERPARSDCDRRLRIGYVSAYFNSRPAGRFLGPLLANHDHSQFEIFCYCDCREPDAGTKTLHGYAGVWREAVRMSDGALADRIHDDRIDILVDLGMHTRGNRMFVFAHKPAPVQMTYLAYCSTTGLETMDYRLSDAYLDPLPNADCRFPNEDIGNPYYSERTLRLRSYWCYPAPAEAPPVAASPCVTGGRITFGCLNDFPKVNPCVLPLWARLLSEVPDSRLLLHSHPGSHRNRVTQIFAEAGVDASRVEFVPMLPMRDYFHRYNQIDIALDPFPWAGGTTTCDALWMGVPVVSLAGQTAVSRAGLSILSQIGLSELVASDPSDYVRIAVELAKDPKRLAELRSTLRQRMSGSPLMDAIGFARDMESLYRTMWEEWCDPRQI